MLEPLQGFPDRGAAYPELVRELAFVEPMLAAVRVHVHLEDRGAKLAADPVLEGEGPLDGAELDGSGGGHGGERKGSFGARGRFGARSPSALDQWPGRTRAGWMPKRWLTGMWCVVYHTP